MPRFLTRHTDGFDVTDERIRIDASRSPYAQSYPAYPEKVAALSRLVGATQFLWAVEKPQGFGHNEQEKPIEWEVEVPEDRVLGFIDDAKWFAFVEGKCAILRSCFSIKRPNGRRFSVLLPFPIRPCEKISRRSV